MNDNLKDEYTGQRPEVKDSVLFRMQPVAFELGLISETLHMADVGGLHLPVGVTEVEATAEDLDERYGNPGTVNA